MEEKDFSEILMRKFKPITDYKPASEGSSSADKLAHFVRDVLDEVQKGGESLGKVMSPYTDEAKQRISELSGAVEEAASKSSAEARSFLAKVLESAAKRIKPE